MVPLIVILIVAILVLAMLARTVRIVPQARARVVERLGRYQRTLDPGLRSSSRSSTGRARSSTCANRSSRSRRSP